MQEVNVSEFRQNLARYLGQVEKGHMLGIARDGYVIAKLVPVFVGDFDLTEAGVLREEVRERRNSDIDLELLF